MGFWGGEGEKPNKLDSWVFNDDPCHDCNFGSPWIPGVFTSKNCPEC